ncbi:hypothetical protein ACMYSQ_005514 [Aspergillus niger]
MDVTLQSRLKSMTQALRISATFPGLLRLLRKNGRRLTDIPSTRDRLDAEGITPDNKESWLALGIDAVIEGSSRWKKVREIIENMDKEEESDAILSTPRPGGHCGPASLGSSLPGPADGRGVRTQGPDCARFRNLHQYNWHLLARTDAYPRCTCNLDGNRLAQYEPQTGVWPVPSDRSESQSRVRICLPKYPNRMRATCPQDMAVKNVLHYFEKEVLVYEHHSNHQRSEPVLSNLQVGLGQQFLRQDLRAYLFSERSGSMRGCSGPTWSTAWSVLTGTQRPSDPQRLYYTHTCTVDTYCTTSIDIFGVYWV